MKWSGIDPIIKIYQESKKEIESINDIKKKLNLQEENILNKTIDIINLKSENNINYESSIDNLIKNMEKIGIIKEKTGDVTSTFYRMNEWLQVEISEIYSKFLNYEPWFRFPFFNMLKTYLYTLLNEFNVVVEKFGFKKAILSEGLFVDLFPAIVMFIQFIQLEILKIPCLLMYGNEYTQLEKENQIQRLIIFSSKNNYSKIPWENMIYESGIDKGKKLN